MRMANRKFPSICSRRCDVGKTLLICLAASALFGFLQYYNSTPVNKKISKKFSDMPFVAKKIRFVERSAANTATLMVTTSNDAEMQYVTTEIPEQYLSTRRDVEPSHQYEWCSTVSSGFLRNSTYVEDLLKYNFTFIRSGYKNPCFYDVCKSIGSSVHLRSLRCLPYFQLIGVDKSGSTDLFARITQHPQILNNNGVINKETTWWPWLRYGQALHKVMRKANFDEYLGYFDAAAGHIERTIEMDKNVSDTGHHYHPLITGDGTPMDFWDFTGWPQIPQNKNRSTPTVLTPHLIKHINPNIKLIVILRDPTERLYSDYVFMKRGIQTPTGFHVSAKQSINYFRNCTRSNDIRMCLFDRSFHLNLKARIHVSMYSVFLWEWLKVFPRKQILILRSEDYSNYIQSNLKRILEFLDVVELPDKELHKIATRARMYQTKKKSKMGPMLNTTRKLLDAFFQPFNEELTKILQDKSYLWRDTKAKYKEKLEEIKKEKERKKRIVKTIPLSKKEALEIEPFLQNFNLTIAPLAK